MFYVLLLKVYSFDPFVYEEKYICWSTSRQKKHVKCVFLNFIQTKQHTFSIVFSCFIRGLFDNKFIILVCTEHILFSSQVASAYFRSINLTYYLCSIQSLPNCDHLFAEVHTLAMYPFSLKWKRSLTRCPISASIFMFCYLSFFLCWLIILNLIL